MGNLFSCAKKKPEAATAPAPSIENPTPPSKGSRSAAEEDPWEVDSTELNELENTLGTPPTNSPSE